jgi:hypothetical protein
MDLGAVGAALNFIVTDLRQNQDNLLSAILKTRVQAPTSPNTKESLTVLPVDRCVHENLPQDFYVLNTKHAESSTLHYKS